jgi:predicted O-linked N-acetylglucosamine transferase (SPINDLY family)
MQPSIAHTQQMLARAFAAHQAGNIAQAEFLYKLVLEADKKQFDALHMLAIIEGQRGNFPAGERLLSAALRIRPDSADALINLGRVQSELGKYADAVATYKKALRLNPRSALAHSNLSIVWRLQQRYEEALLHCDAALDIAQNHPDAWSNRGNVLFDLDRFEEALADYDKAVELQPNHAEAQIGRGNVLTELKRYGDALAAYDRALAVRPDLAEAWLGRGNAFTEFKQYDDAFAAYDRALALKPDLAKAWLGRGNVFAELKRYDDAFAAYDRALALKPDLAKAWLGRGNVFTELRQYEDAFAACDKALNLEPDLEYAAGHRLHAKLYICNWTNLEAEVAHLMSAVRDHKPVSVPLAILALPSSPADQLQCARRFVQDKPAFPPIWRGEVYSHDRIRVAYVSSDLREHPVAYLTAGLFEHHDKSRFEVTAISFGAEQDSDFCRRIKASFERFIDVRFQSDQDIAALIRQLEIDIVVDLNGYTQNGRPGVLARRPAPVQVNYLGYSGTMGADYVDYIIADPTVIPAEQFEFYSEKVVWLPDSFLVNDAARSIAERTPTRAELHLPDTGFVFCCFNQSYKINPTMFDIWMRLLKEADGSVLWLRADAAASRNLRLEAERRRVAPERLVFAPPVALIADHLARHRQADLFLDTLPYNAHTTASDALWAGVPVITCLGSTFAGRVAGSLNRAVGLPELVTESLPDYEALALRIATEPAFCASLKDKLARNRGVFALFDSQRFASNIEAAYATMWQRYQRGEPPQRVVVDPA